MLVRGGVVSADLTAGGRDWAAREGTAAVEQSGPVRAIHSDLAVDRPGQLAGLGSEEGLQAFTEF